MTKTTRRVADTSRGITPSPLAAVDGEGGDQGVPHNSREDRVAHDPGRR